MENISSTALMNTDFQTVKNVTKAYTKKDPMTFDMFVIFAKFMVIVLYITLATGVSTNAMNIRTFIRMGLEDSVTISFFALSISDFVLCSVGFAGNTNFLLEMMAREGKLRLYIPPFIPSIILHIIRRVFTSITVLITTYLSIQRCLCVLIPFRVKGLFGKFKTYYFLMGIFIFSVIRYSFYIWRYKIIKYHDPVLNSTYYMFYVRPESQSYFFVMEVILGIILNCTYISINVVCLVIMYVFLRKAARFRESAVTKTEFNSTKPTGHEASKVKVSSKETQALKQVATIATIFVLTNLPYLGFGLANLLLPDFGIGQAYHYLYTAVIYIMSFTELANSSVNFFVYYHFNTKFREFCVFVRRD